ncbi:MAG: 50S ribosomal protein L17, partial [Aquificaceae bacterium]|nr:50S ribosomal protein L17 [Aquificaceae bacterium]
QRLALYRSLARSIILYERIETSVERAKAVKPFVERLITLSKKGDLSARRLALSMLPDRKAVKKLFDDIGPRFESRNGGYTRIIKLATKRPGDGCELAIIEFVE